MRWCRKGRQCQNQSKSSRANFSVDFYKYIYLASTSYKSTCTSLFIQTTKLKMNSHSKFRLENGKIYRKMGKELELNASASEAWDLYGTLKLADLIVQELPNMIQKMEAIEGDGGVGTILHVTFAPGIPGPTYYKEKFTKVDNEKRIKEAEVIEGGYLELGFTFFRVGFEVIEKGEGSSIIKFSIECELKEEAKDNQSLVSKNMEMLEKIAEIAKTHFGKNKPAN